MALVLAGCGGNGGRTVHVEPRRSEVDEAVRITVRGLEPRETATLRLRAADTDGVRWAASATFRADAEGTVDVRRQAPRSGSYAGVSGMGLVWSMRTAVPPATGRFMWPTGPSTFTLDVLVGGEVLASTTFDRGLPSRRYTLEATSAAGDGFAGLYFAPTGLARRPPVLLLGGAGGGLPLPLDAFLLANRGYPVLALAYFREEGVPATLSRIPLEYFRRALRWLDAKPHADGRGVVVWGISRGSEAALLLGVHYSDLVRAVVGLVPSNVSHCSEDCDGPAWTIGGSAVPFTRQFDRARPADDPRAVIPVERIRGDVLVVCGGRDAVWDSCAHAEAIVERGDATLLSYPRAGHGLGTLAPYQPILSDEPTHADDQRARADAWPKVLEFLDAA